ncbi:MAG: hypothetical protein ACKOFB_05695 [bacterium]
MKSLLILCACLLFGCMSAPKSCINERTTGTILRWGDGSLESGTYKGFEAKAENLGIFSIERSNVKESMKSNRLDSMDAKVFCMRLQEVVTAFTTVQSLYSPGKTYRSVEYINTRTNVHMKAVWNPEFATFGSKEFRSIFDSLMVSVPLVHQAQH